MQNNVPHIPVLLNEAISSLGEVKGKVIIDGTFGAGGYSKALLAAGAKKVIAVDRDDTALAIGLELQKTELAFTIVKGLFSDMADIAASCGFQEVDGVVLDIGVSSMQIDTAERGFSFMKDGALDMRMGLNGITAAEVVNTFPEKELADIIFKYGQERKSRLVASSIVARRSSKPFSSTKDLADVICSVVKRSKDGIHPATRTFQALRIYVNDELNELKKGLEAATSILSCGGRLSVVTFHSLEDGIVKDFMREKAGLNNGTSRYLPSTENACRSEYTLVFKKPVLPTEKEIAENPRSRSAKLRTLEKRRCE